MSDYNPHKKFQLNQSTEKTDPKVELAALGKILSQAEKDENYEFALLLYKRIESIKRGETQDWA